MKGLRNECWAITDHAAGNQRQALALAERLGLPIRHLILEPRPPWSWLAPRLINGLPLILPPHQRASFSAPWPVVAIGCGRSAALFTRLLRPLSAGHTRTVQILDPRIDPADWDIVIAPRHDGLTGPNVLNPLGSMNPIDDAWLADAHASYAQFGDLPQPRVGVFLGGPRRELAIDGDYAQRLAQRLRERWQREGGSLLVVASRRTPAAAMQSMRSMLEGIPGLRWSGPGDGANPYPGVLAWADRLVITPDSVNMLSEACAVGCPVETFTPTAPTSKLAHFHRALHEAGLLHELEGHDRGGHKRDDKATSPSPPPLRETADIAAQLVQRLGIPLPDHRPDND
ncbi:mitochondrial fission ELM1 family protein [Dyella sp. A6]|uniref:mitochondrial fission ELM1 family protein n=1 Tax=Dyella aluminiiresistens TaxID=3069105 RepID=UPI002E782EE5|nr:mitochondrial fission ELM1 family protein [Dyella sp. A6]